MRIAVGHHHRFMVMKSAVGMVMVMDLNIYCIDIEKVSKIYLIYLQNVTLTHAKPLSKEHRAPVRFVKKPCDGDTQFSRHKNSCFQIEGIDHVTPIEQNKTATNKANKLFKEHRIESYITPA